MVTVRELLGWRESRRVVLPELSPENERACVEGGITVADIERDSAMKALSVDMVLAQKYSVINPHLRPASAVLPFEPTSTAVESRAAFLSSEPAEVLLTSLTSITAPILLPNGFLIFPTLAFELPITGPPLALTLLPTLCSPPDNVVEVASVPFGVETDLFALLLAGIWIARLIRVGDGIPVVMIVVVVLVELAVGVVARMESERFDIIER